MTEEEITEEVEKYLKEYYDEAIKYGISRQYYNTKSQDYDLGYLVVTGGQALKYYLPDDINTLDYDLKFFVSPSKEAILDFKERKKLELMEEVNLDEDEISEEKLNVKTMNLIIYLSNILRSRITRQMIYDIFHYPKKLPKFFDRKNQYIRFRFTVIQRYHNDGEIIEHYDELRFNKEDGKNRATIIKRDEEGNIVKPIQFVPYYYNGAQNFAIRCSYKGMYKKKFVKGEFSIIDVGLNFHNPKLLKLLNYDIHNYNYFYGNKSYYNFRNFLGMTFPFNKNFFVVNNNIRYPDLNYMLFDQIQLLHIFINTSFPENMLDFQEEKINKYRRRIDLFLDYYIDTAPEESIESLRRYISISISRLDKIDEIIKRCFQFENGKYSITPLSNCSNSRELIDVHIYNVIYNYLMYLVVKICEYPSILDDEILITLFNKEFYSNDTNYSKTIDCIKIISKERDISYEDTLYEMCKEILVKLNLLKRNIKDNNTSVVVNYIDYIDSRNFELIVIIEDEQIHHEFTIMVGEDLTFNDFKNFIKNVEMSEEDEIDVCTKKGTCVLKTMNSIIENEMYYDGYLVNTTIFDEILSLKIIDTIKDLL